MGLFRAIVEELKRAWKMTDRRNPNRPLMTWLADKHLRTGFLLGLPAFGAAVAWMFMAKPPKGLAGVVLFFAAAVTNVVWLGYAAWSRRRSG